jgi:hypothetical protein
MDELIALLGISARVIGVVRTHGGDHEPAAVNTISNALIRDSKSHLIIRRQESDGCYGQPSEEALSSMSNWNALQLRNYELRQVKCPRIFKPTEAQNLPAANLVDDWPEFTPENLEIYKKQLPDHRFILTLGEDNGINDYEFKASMQLCDRVVLTAYDFDERHKCTASNWLKVASEDERQKIVFALCVSHLREWSVNFLTVDELSAMDCDTDEGFFDESIED